jgi:hypothetical protein
MTTKHMMYTIIYCINGYLIIISVVGCKDLQVSPSMWYKRDGATVTVGCKVNKVSWNLRCEGTQWMGVIGNCTQEGRYLYFKGCENKFKVSWSLSPYFCFQRIQGHQTPPGEYFPTVSILFYEKLY